MTEALKNGWSAAVPELQRLRGYHALDNAEIATEFHSHQQSTDSTRVADIVHYVNASSDETIDSSNLPKGNRTILRLVENASTMGLGSLAELQSLAETSHDSDKESTPHELAQQLVQRSADSPRPLKLIGDYLLLDKIGRGGMGEVYRAMHLRMDRMVAIKLLRSGISDGVLRKRFETEIKSLAKLNHPNIVTAHDAGESDGAPFLVMEYVEGADLSKLVYRLGQLPMDLALNFTLQAAKGLQCAHEQGIVHRDVKPSNMLIDCSNTIKISDLGLAALNKTNGGSELTAPGTALGTYSYMAPEQLGSADQADHRADIYSLGCTLHFLLIGRPVAEGSSNHERAEWHRSGEIPSLRDLRIDVSELLDETFQQMLARQPEDRPTSMAQVVESLEKCIEIIDPDLIRRPPQELNSTRARHGDETRDQNDQETGSRGKTVPQTLPAAKSVHKSWKPGAFIIAGTIMIALSIVLAINFGQISDNNSGKVFDYPEKITNSIGMKLTHISPGTFEMGAPVGERDSRDVERPQHTVILTRNFYIGTYEVTRDQYLRLMDPKNYKPDPGPAPDEPNRINQSKLPMTNVTWYDAREFCKKLNELEKELNAGRTYRLPTEAEWEYCCRAGTTSAYHTGADIKLEQANFGAEFIQAEGTYPYLKEVGSYPPNPWRLYDMAGNAMEWCLDRKGPYKPGKEVDPTGSQTGDHMIMRGSGARCPKKWARSAYRNYMLPQFSTEVIGFRVICELNSK